MKVLSLVLACVLPLAAVAAPDVTNFDGTSPGELPEGWIEGVTGTGKPKWGVEKYAASPSKPKVLKQSGRGDYPWCVNTNVTRLTNGFVQVKFKALAGKEDQAAGLIWRWQDGDNYYVARANALENNLTIYHTIKGRRTQFKTVHAKVAPDLWHTLRVDFDGPHFVVTLNGRVVLEADNDKITSGGAVGLWTKADSVTLFDDFSWEEKPE